MLHFKRKNSTLWYLCYIQTDPCPVPHQVLGPLAEGDYFHADDFHLLQKLTLGTSAEKIMAKVKQMSLTPKKYEKAGKKILLQ